MTETSKDAALPYRDASLPVAERVADLLGRMSLEEKVDQMTSVMPSFCMRDGRVALDLVAAAAGNGIGQVSRPVGSARIAPREGAELVNAIQHHFVEETRLGIPAIMHEECLSGVQAHGTTIFPQSIGNACTWDPDLIEQMTTAIRRQMRALGIHQGLSPVLDVARDARWGRIEETFGEDPYLVARIATAFVRGLQGDDPATGVMATLKHFIGYSFSEGGRNIGPVRIGERELRDVFGFPFETAIQEAHAWSVMNAYHENDGVPVIASPEILTGLLRDEYGFDGTLVSDYFSINFTQVLHGVAASLKEAAVLSVKAGLDTELPLKSAYAQPLIEAVAEGLVEEAEIDRLVERVLAWKFRLGLFENAYVDPGAAVDLDTPADRALARRLAQRSIVLLKNESGLLPLNPNLGCVAVIGPNADREWALLGDYSFDLQSYSLELVAKGVNEPGGPAAEGGVEPETAVPVVTVLEGIRSHVGPATEVRFAPGCGVVGERDEALFAEAVAAARGADVAVVVVGDQAGIFAMGTVGENRDSCSLRLPGVQEELIRAIHATGTPAVVVLTNGRPFALGWVADNAPAIVEAWFPGEEGGNAIADVLFGEVTPTGKLCVSFPRSPGHEPFHYNHKRTTAHDYVDAPFAPVFPFGHGLGYTSFEYVHLAVEPGTVQPDGEVRVSCTITNTGERAGEEVVQLYVRDVVGSVARPVLELKGFARVSLAPGERARVRFALPTDLLAFHDREVRLVVEPGAFEVFVGASSADIRLSGGFEITGETRLVKRPRRLATRVEIERA